MSTPTQPPDGAAKWALHAVHDIQTLTRLWVESDEEEKAAAIILRHYATHAASERDETVRLLEECASMIDSFTAFVPSDNASELCVRIRTRLKEQTR